MRGLTHFALPGLLVLSVIIGGCGGGSDSGGGEAPAMDYSGTYSFTANLENGQVVESGTMVITQSDSNVTIIATSDTYEGQTTFTGTVSGSIMTLTEEEGGEDYLAVVLGFSSDGQAFSGTWSEAGDSGGITGTKIS